MPNANMARWESSDKKFTYQTAARRYLATAFNYRLLMQIKKWFVIVAQIEGFLFAIKNYNQNILAVFCLYFITFFFYQVSLWSNLVGD